MFGQAVVLKSRQIQRRSGAKYSLNKEANKSNEFLKRGQPVICF